jgi:hypothetical protein
MDNAQNCDSYINMPSSQIYIYYVDIIYERRLSKYSVNFQLISDYIK